MDMSDCESRYSDTRVLIVGIGNLLMGDDGFGPEVIMALEKESLKENIELRDMGIAGITTATELEDYDIVIFVDAMNVDEEPGSLRMIKIDVEEISPEEALNLSRFSIHELSLETVLKLSKAIGTLPEEVYILGCQPENLDVGHDLTPKVRNAIPKAIREIQNLVEKRAYRL